MGSKLANRSEESRRPVSEGTAEKEAELVVNDRARSQREALPRGRRRHRQQIRRPEGGAEPGTASPNHSRKTDPPGQPEADGAMSDAGAGVCLGANHRRRSS